MKDKKYKAFYFNQYHLLGTEIITSMNGAGYEQAKIFADVLADEHYPTCTHVEVCELAEKKPQCWTH